MSDLGDKARRLHDGAGDMHPRFHPDRDSGDDLRGVLARVRVRALSLAAQQPHLVGEDPRILYSRLVTPTTLVTYESALQRAAIAVLLVAAVERAGELRVDLGGDAA